MSLHISLKRRAIVTTTLSLIICSFVIVGGAHLYNTQRASALSGSDFNPGRIIDDVVFYNDGSMSPSQIQTFLNSKVPACDTQGTGPSGYGNTRAEYAASKGWHGPPYTCLKDYKQNTPQVEAVSSLCAALSAKSNSSSAQIIYDVAVACGINPQVLVVLLEKEQSLVTDVWPLDIQFKNATGFACPDTAPCDPNYAGFFYQVYYAARQFKVYKANPNSYNYRAGRTNTIYWHPDLSRCGSSQVYIENQATAALYIYTPYRPNQAALNNLRGTGDNCSSYGNRNFWRLFADWFGNTTAKPLPKCTTTTIDCVYEFLNEDTQKSFYTSDITERDQVYKQNFSFIGIAFHSRKADDPNAYPVKRLYNATQNFHLWTGNKSEIDNLLKTGEWSDEGVKFYMDPTASNSGPTVHRLYSQAGTGRHILSSNATEIKRLKILGYRDEGVVFRTASLRTTPPIPATGKANTYRFYFQGRHFWTEGLNERETLIDRGYKYEGVAWENSKLGTTPVYRVYSPTGYHFWTTSSYERDQLVRSGWRNEGTAWSSLNQGQATYRLYNKSTGRHLFTTSSYEKDTLIKSNTWRDEGISWYQ